MADRPILFSGPMVRALLDGRKSQTRRLLKPQPPDWAPFCQNLQMLNVLGQWVPSGLWTWGEDEQNPPRALRRWPIDKYGEHRALRLKFEPGDRLWVKEAWQAFSDYDHCRPSEIPPGSEIVWLAEEDALWGRYRHARFMPRWASRITLIVTDVRVQRLQDISEEDAIAEGVERGTWSDVIPMLEDPDDATAYAPDTPIYWAPDDDSEDNVCFSAREAFERLWTSLHGPDAWDENPFVAAISFTTHRCNIDKMEPQP
jgi:hypothetical protein